jgi:uncharacterized protein YdeI (YjbR/CyaY-like superfamily)
MPDPMKPKLFSTPQAFQKWLAKNHATASELVVGFWKVGSGKQSMTWPESVDEALCFGWIDGIRRSLDEQSYTVRFTPRKPKSIWSSVNLERVEALKVEGRMQPSGLAAYEKLTENKSSVYSYEQRTVDLPEPYSLLLRKNKQATKFFESQTATYRKAACWWVVSAKKVETRLKRIETLIELSEQGQLIPQFIPRRPKK